VILKITGESKEEFVTLLLPTTLPLGVVKSVVVNDRSDKGESLLPTY